MLAREKAENAHHQRMSQLAADYSFNSEKAATDHGDRMSQLAADYNLDIEQTARDHGNRLAVIEAEYDAASEKAEQDHGDRLAAIEAEYDAASEKAEQDHGDRLAAIVAAWSADVERIVTVGLQRLDAAISDAEAWTPPVAHVTTPVTQPDVEIAIADLDSGTGDLERPDVVNLINDYLFADETIPTQDVAKAIPPIDISNLFTTPDFGHVMDAAQGHDIGEMVGAGRGGDTYNIYGDVLDGEDFYHRTNEARLLQTRRGG